jgi:hypothetical protein
LKLSPDKLFSDLKSKSLKPSYGKLFSNFAPYFPTGLLSPPYFSVRSLLQVFAGTFMNMLNQQFTPQRLPPNRQR